MTTQPNPPAIADHDALTVRRSIRIAASVDEVWPTITEPEQISRWFGSTRLDGLEAGSAGTITFEGEAPIPLRVEAVDRPRSITYAWNNDDARPDARAAFDAATATRFTFSLDADGDGTLLTVVETGFERTSSPAYNVDSHRFGWTEELDKLVRLHERAVA